MTHKFHELDCPDCRFNNDNFACMNSQVALRPSEWEKRNMPMAGFTQFKGTTKKRCHKKYPKTP